MVARRAEILDSPCERADLVVNRNQVLLGADNESLRRTKNLDTLHIVLRHGGEDCAVTDHVVLSESIPQLFPEERLAAVIVPDGGKAPTDYDPLVSDVHATNWSANAEKDVTEFPDATFNRAKLAVRREPLTEICDALVERLPLPDLVVEFGFGGLARMALN
jgi:hypothetical protein